MVGSGGGGGDEVEAIWVLFLALDKQRMKYLMARTVNNDNINEHVSLSIKFLKSLRILNMYPLKTGLCKTKAS